MPLGRAHAAPSGLAMQLPPSRGLQRRLGAAEGASRPLAAAAPPSRLPGGAASCRARLSRVRARLPPLQGPRVVRVVTASLGRFVERRSAQICTLGAAAAGMGLALSQGIVSGWMEPAMAQVAARPADTPAEAWILLLVASDFARTAVCAGVCWATMRWYAQQRERSARLARLLAHRQGVLHRFSAEVLDRLRETGVEDELGTVAAFREWYLAQLSESDLLLHLLEGKAGGSGPSDPGEQLQATLGRLGMTAADLMQLAAGELISGRTKRPASKRGGKAQGPSEPLPRRVAAKRDPMKKERERLERLVRLRTRADHHSSFLAYLEEQEAVLERALEKEPAPEPGDPSHSAHLEQEERQPVLGAPAAEAGTAGKGGDPPSQPGGRPQGRRSSCTSEDMLAAFDEGDCSVSDAEGPDVSGCEAESAGSGSSMDGGDR